MKQQWESGTPNAAKLEKFSPPTMITRHAGFNAPPENIGYAQIILTLKDECMAVWVGEWMDECNRNLDYMTSCYLFPLRKHASQALANLSLPCTLSCHEVSVPNAPSKPLCKRSIFTHCPPGESITPHHWVIEDAPAQTHSDELILSNGLHLWQSPLQLLSYNCFACNDRVQPRDKILPV